MRAKTPPPVMKTASGAPASFFSNQTSAGKPEPASTVSSLYMNHLLDIRVRRLPVTNRGLKAPTKGSAVELTVASHSERSV